MASESLEPFDGEENRLMSRRRPDNPDLTNLTPDELDAAIRGIIRQLQDATIAREWEASLTTADIDDPNSFERGLMEQLAQLRLIRKQRQRSSNPSEQAKALMNGA